MNSKYKKVIICPNCKSENLLQSNYCSFCGCDIKELKENEYQKSFAYKFGKIYKATKKLLVVPKFLKNPLKVITKNKKVEVVLTVLMLAGGIFLAIYNKPIWTGVSITSTDEYSVTYSLKHYEISTDNDSIDLSLVSTKEVDTVHIEDKNNKTILDAKSNQQLRMKIDDKENEYTLIAYNTDGSTSKLKFIFK